METGWLWAVFLTFPLWIQSFTILAFISPRKLLAELHPGLNSPKLESSALGISEPISVSSLLAIVLSKNLIFLFAWPVYRGALSPQTDSGSIWPCHREPCDSRWKNPHPSPSFQSSPPRPGLFYLQPAAQSLHKQSLQGWKELLMRETALFHPHTLWMEKFTQLAALVDMKCFRTKKLGRTCLYQSC